MSARRRGVGEHRWRRRPPPPAGEAGTSQPPASQPPASQPRPNKPKADVRRRAVLCLAGGLLLLIGVYLGAIAYTRPSSPGQRIGLQQFLADVRTNRIQSATILIVDRRIVGAADSGPFWLDYGSSDVSALFSMMAQAMDAAGTPVHVDQQWLKGLFAGPQVTVLLPSLILVDGIMLAYLVVQGGGLLGFGRSGSRRVSGDEGSASFADVAGAKVAVEELAEIRDFLIDPQRFASVGAVVPKGVLLMGPPGCGKTLLAKAVAGEAGVPFFSISASAFMEMYVGVGAARIRDLFREAGAAAPAIIFIDELDAVGRHRSASALGGQDEREASLNQLLVGLDGFDSTAGVVVMAATNRPDILDPALLRPGRFDRHVTVELPDVAGRGAILEVHARGKPLAPDVDLAAVARRTPGFSGADLAAVMNEAALLAARRGAAHIAPAMIWEAVERVVGGPQRRSHLLTPREKELCAYHECGHAVASVVASPSARVAKISLVARGRSGGSTWMVDEEERSIATADELQGRLVALLGGRAAEEVVWGTVASGAEDDLERATELARRMVGQLGMSPRLGPMSLKAPPASSELAADGSARPSEKLAALVDEEVQALLVTAAARARSALEDNRPLLDRLATALLRVETLEGAELDALLSPAPVVAGS